VFKEIGEKAVVASKEINQLDSDVKNNLIKDMSEQLIEDTDLILKANKKDLDNAKDLDLSSALVDRLTLTKERIEKAKNLKNVEGIIVGKAIYDGDIKLEELVKEDA